MIYHSHKIRNKSKPLNEAVVTADQNHTNIVCCVRGRNNKYFGDALVTKLKRIPIGVLSADCIPVIYYDEINEVTAVSHNGWKGVIDSISQNTLAEMELLGAQKECIKCIIGPGIGGCCYDIFGERKMVFEKRFKNHLRKIFSKRDNKLFLDLKECTKLQLLELGINERNIEMSKICTSCDDTYPSYKRNNKTLESILSYVWME